MTFRVPASHRRSSVTPVVLLVVSLLAACVSPPFRVHEKIAPNPAVETSVVRLVDPAEQERVQSSSFEYHRDDGYMLGFVELDDQGWMWNPEQFKRVRHEIEKNVFPNGTDKPGKSALLVGFIHGWRHNAAVCDRDVVCFREVLSGLAAYEKARARRCASSPLRNEFPAGYCDERTVAGVFVGWRGNAMQSRWTWPNTWFGWANLFSFYSRKNAAHRIGQSGHLASVIGWLHALDERLSETAPRHNSRLVLAGHSFGGAMLFSAVSGATNENVAEARLKPGRSDENDCGTFAPRPIADLVILVNPAFEALRYQSVHDATKDLVRCPKGRPNYLVTIGSEVDTATGTWFPIGRRISTVLDRLRAGQRAASIRALGHYGPFRTHNLIPNPDQDAYPILITEAADGRSCECPSQLRHGLIERLVDDTYGAAETLLKVQRGTAQPTDLRRAANPLAQIAYSPTAPGEEPGGCETPTCLQPLGTIDPDNPFKVIYVSQKIVNGHSDIYNQKILDFLIRAVGRSDRPVAGQEDPKEPGSAGSPDSGTPPSNR